MIKMDSLAKQGNVFRPWDSANDTHKIVYDKDIKVKKESSDLNNTQSETILKNLEALIPKQEVKDNINEDQTNLSLSQSSVFQPTELDSLAIAYRGVRAPTNRFVSVSYK